MHIISVYIGYCVSKALLLKVWFVGQQCCLIRKLVRNAESCDSQAWWPGNDSQVIRVTLMHEEHWLNAVFLVEHSSLLTINNTVMNTSLAGVFREVSIYCIVTAVMTT